MIFIKKEEGGYLYPIEKLTSTKNILRNLKRNINKDINGYYSFLGKEKVQSVFFFKNKSKKLIKIWDSAINGYRPKMKNFKKL